MIVNVVLTETTHCYNYYLPTKTCQQPLAQINATITISALKLIPFNSKNMYYK